MEIYVNSNNRPKNSPSIFSFLVAGGITIFLIGLGYLFLFSPVFRIKEFSYNCAPLLNCDEIKTSLDKNLKKNIILSLVPDDNLFFWRNSQNVINKTKQEIPAIKDLILSKDYLNKRIIIEATEREKYGIVCGGNGCFWIDNEGLTFYSAPEAEGGMINKLKVNNVVDLGKKILTENYFANLKVIYEILDKASLSMKSLYIPDMDLLEVRTIGEICPELIFSLKNNPQFALTAIEEFKKKGLFNYTRIDFTVDGRVYYK